MNDAQMNPDGELVVRTLAMPGDANPKGDIFGGWVLSQMDIAGGLIAKQHAKGGRAVTVSIDGMSFKNPVKIGDMVSCYAKLVEHGRSSMKIKIETWTYCFDKEENKMVTNGVFTYVAIDENGKPCQIIKPLKAA